MSPTFTRAVAIDTPNLIWSWETTPMHWLIISAHDMGTDRFAGIRLPIGNQAGTNIARRWHHFDES